MTRTRKVIRTVAAALCAGSFLFQPGPCNNNQLRTQFAAGLRTTLNGVFNLGTTRLSNQVFDVDD